MEGTGVDNVEKDLVVKEEQDLFAEKEKFMEDEQAQGDEADENNSMKDVSDWVRRSVLFWNKQDTISIDGTSDTQENELVEFVCSESKAGEAGPESPPVETPNDSITEPTECIDIEKEMASSGDMILDVENIQKLLIEPFIMDEELENKTASCDSLASDSPYYTLNFPKYTKHVYSPLYEEHTGLNNECPNPKFRESNDWNIAETLNKLNQTWGQLMSDSDKTEADREEARDFSIEHGSTNIEKMGSKPEPLNCDIFKAIKKVQETLGEIAEEIETTRTRKTSKDRDPNVILVNLLSRIQPPVNRDSFACSPIEETSHIVQDNATNLQSSVPGSDKLTAQGNSSEISEMSAIEGTGEEFDVFKELADPGKSTEEVLQEFMQKLSNTSKPSSAIRGLLKRISEEIASDNSGEITASQTNMASADQNTRVSGDGATSVGFSKDCMIVIEQEGREMCEQPDENAQAHPGSNDKETDARNSLTERRTSSVSAHSSLPTSPNATNYDSGFSELTKTLTYARKESLTSFVPEEPTNANIERKLKESFEKSKNGFDSETSTDWSPCSTLSNNDTVMKQIKSGLKQSPFQRVSPRRRSTGTSNSRPSSKIQSHNTNSCPNFQRGSNPSPLLDPATNYTKAEVEAIRKFLSLTSVYFSSKTTANEVSSSTYNELMDRGDIEEIHRILERQREDLERQRRKQDDLLSRLGDLLFQLMSLKEEHLSSTQKQTKALTLLKKQFDIQKKEHNRAQEAMHSQIKKLEEQLISQLSLVHRPTEQAQSSVASPSVETGLLRLGHRGQIVWKLTGITRKVTRIHAGAAESVNVSEAFYTGQYGYKMAAWIYLNGRADFKGRGVSVYVCPLCGEYDAILQWPIKPVYTFTLIDQDPDPKKRHDHVKVRNVVEISKKCDTALSNKGGIPRPLNGSKSFIIGFDDFISQTELTRGKYIYDDTLFLKVEAEITY